ncbi:MAG: SMI1/KNR4 family protein [Paludibacteraceae bacterium]|nr:SMI1/KNR4 family protein [Paludibacteraceae bacterium]
MNKYLEIEKLLFRYDKYGTELTDNGTILIGHPNYLPKLWWLIQLYPKLEENDIKVLEKECDMPIPHQYKEFLLHFANGFDFQNGDFTLYGLRKILGRSIEASRQPFSLKTPNRSERNLIKNVKNSFFFIGSYSWDGSRLYIDIDTQKVHLCSRYDAKSLYEWNNLEDMIISELTRLYSYYTEDGKPINEHISNLPI